MNITAFLSWDILATFSGAVGLTVIIVQLLKLPIDKVWKIPTRYLVYAVCFTIMLAAQFFIGSAMSLQTVAVTAINAVLGTLTAMSLYEQIIELPEQKKLAAAYQYITTGETGLGDATDDTGMSENEIVTEDTATTDDAGSF